ncbi:T-cell-interacting, activating receptor on myeloid cells protein 1 isoform X3 [Desmodus rotundus]|uniref:T-cell-interacting, activating receptor on myeloid cells protein 1 isoform X3 n=1 Tax=Desmodus rotundus TaxID=9430 RepID=UPI00238189F2|nr:T-cell-interacting, activating receptor on myeloid cells protein 1 isoform X3 [Desmodus rotundus]
MILLSLALFCVGLCVGQRDWIIDGQCIKSSPGLCFLPETLPRPSISAWPSWVVPAHSMVTLRCLAPMGGVKFILRKNNVTVRSLESSETTEARAELHLTHLQNSAAGVYTCEYYISQSPGRRSPPSDVLLLVTGYLPKPSLQAPHGGKLTTGENVTLQCQKPRHVIEPYTFALLKKGTSTPIQFHCQGGMETDFPLRSVTVDDTGNYSCVYYQKRAPFHASAPSDLIEIWVTEREEENPAGDLVHNPGQCEGSQYPLQGQIMGGKTFKPPEPSEQETGTHHSDETESAKRAGTLGTTEITLIVTFTSLFLLAAFLLIYKYTCCGAARNRATKRSRSSKNPEEVMTDASPAMTSCSPALDEACQESRAEEPHGVMYAELNARALSEGPSNQMKQPLETCVYSTLKT